MVPSSTIVTCEANQLARPIHERMPVILADSETWEGWLDPALDAKAARELLEPLSAERMIVRHANPVVTRRAMRVPTVWRHSGLNQPRTEVASRNALPRRRQKTRHEWGGLRALNGSGKETA